MNQLDSKLSIWHHPHMKTLKREAKPMFRLTVRIPEALAEEVKVRAIREKTTLQQLVTDLLAEYLKRPAKRREEER